MEHLPATRAGDADREQALVTLRDAVVSGHLTLDEFSGRVEQAEVARTHAELEAVTADLPDKPRTADVPVRHRAVFSRLQRSGRWELAPRARVSSVGGTVVLDLRQATLHGSTRPACGCGPPAPSARPGSARPRTLTRRSARP